MVAAYYSVPNSQCQLTARGLTTAATGCSPARVTRLPRTLVVVCGALLALTLAGSALSARAPTKAERRAIIDAVRSGNPYVGQAPRRCDAASIVRVSTVDAHYALWTQNNRQAQRIGGCVVGDGYIIVHLQPNTRWRIRTQGSGGAPCSLIGRRVARDLLPGVPCE